MSTDMDIFMDMMSDQDTPFVEVVEKCKPNSYYQGLGIHILKQLEDKEHYFHFLQSIVTDYSKLSKEQQKIIKDKMGIVPEKIIKEKIIYKEKKKNNKNKPKLNSYDDY
tara:strand:+ start:1408 stop:1734 length:327 start_codon:yes stop_codon:yes gene_type:complete